MPAFGKGEAAPAPEDPLMSPDQLTRRCRRLLERLSRARPRVLPPLLALLVPVSSRSTRPC